QRKEKSFDFSRIFSFSIPQTGSTPYGTTLPAARGAAVRVAVKPQFTKIFLAAAVGQMRRSKNLSCPRRSIIYCRSRHRRESGKCCVVAECLTTSLPARPRARSAQSVSNSLQGTSNNTRFRRFLPYLSERLQRFCRGEPPIGDRFDAWPASARSFARWHTESTRERTQAGAAAIRSS